MPKLKGRAIEISRSAVETTAKIIGPQGAAAAALLDADKFLESNPAGQVRFLTDAKTIVVEKKE